MAEIDPNYVYIYWNAGGETGAIAIDREWWDSVTKDERYERVNQELASAMEHLPAEARTRFLWNISENPTYGPDDE